MFYQNANNIICNIQDNIIVVLIGGKKMLMGAPAHPTTQLFLITVAVIKGNKLCNDQCFFCEVTVLLLFAFVRPCAAHLDGREILMFESSSTKRMWALRRETSLLMVLCSMIYSSRHMSVEVVFGRFTCTDMCCVGPHLLVVSHSRRLPRHTYVRRREGDGVKEPKCKLRGMNRGAQKTNNCGRFVKPSGRENPLFRNNPCLPNCQINFFLQQWLVRGGN